MTVLPAATDFTGVSVNEAGFKSAITDMREYLNDLFGTDGAKATARNTMGLGNAATLVTGTDPGDIPLNSDLGTASLLNTGLADGDIPTNIQINENVRVFTKAQGVAQTSLTDAANVDWDLDDAPTAQLIPNGNRVMNAPTNLRTGFTYVLIVKQPGVGGKTLDFSDVIFKFPGGVEPTLSTGNNAVDVLTFHCDGSSLFGVSQLNFL